MAQMTAALFDTREDARRAVHALRDHGVSEDNISVLAVADDGSGKTSDMDASERVVAPGKDEGISVSTPGDAGMGAAEGAAIGAGLGLAAALASIFIPGFGLVTAGGALATALGGAAAATAGGAVTGGVAGYLADLGVPDHAAHHYTEGIKQGGVLVSVHDTDEATPDEIQQIFTKYNGHSGGSYTGVGSSVSASGASNPDLLDASNRRLGTEESAPGVRGSAGLDTGDIVEDSTLDDGRLVTSPRSGDQRLDRTAGSEGSASSRINDARLGPNPGDPGASASGLNSPTTPRTVVSDVSAASGSVITNPTTPTSPAPVVLDEDDDSIV